MRRAGLDQPYERLKELTRGTKVTRGSIQAFIRAQELPVNDELILMKLTPASYIGLASKLVDYLDLE